MLFSRVFDFVWEVGRLGRFEEWPVGPQDLAAFVLAVGAGFGVRTWGRANQFFNEVVVELSKVTWPLGKETVASSGVVAVLVSVAALILAVIDLIWAKMALGVFKF
ncbi:MAG: preprotein translocase subunit SecE [Deltaproteobacteria bacterium]|nr:preprotein translocase subunit SecE [Deltaproteobacteria bacterium]